VSAWCLRYIYTGVVSNETQEIGAAINRPANLLKDKAEQGAGASRYGRTGARAG
jgi:hypothetical protein